MTRAWERASGPASALPIAGVTRPRSRRDPRTMDTGPGGGQAPAPLLREFISHGGAAHTGRAIPWRPRGTRGPEGTRRATRAADSRVAAPKRRVSDRRSRAMLSAKYPISFPREAGMLADAPTASRRRRHPRSSGVPQPVREPAQCVASWHEGPPPPRGARDRECPAGGARVPDLVTSVTNSRATHAAPPGHRVHAPPDQERFP